MAYEVRKLDTRLSNIKKTFLVAFVPLTLLLMGCDTDLPQSTLFAAGSVADAQQDLFYLLFWVAMVIFVIVECLLIYIMFRFRTKSGRENELPEQTHGNTKLEIGWTILPVLIVIAVTIPTIRGIAGTYEPPKVLADSPSISIDVVGHQWWWEYKYLDSNGDLDFATANEMHIPVNTVVKLRLYSDDVIHSFSIPRLAGSRDAVPGRENIMWFDATEEGIFVGQCKEFCGESHALMKTIVIAQNTGDYLMWTENQRSIQDDVANETDLGWGLFESKGCVGCHTIRGTAAVGEVGPDLTHFGSRITIAANALHKGSEDLTFTQFFANPVKDSELVNLERWLTNPPGVKPGSLMPALGLSKDETSTLANFLEGLE
jgi:cytochrome c oxidase subunit 2